MCYVALKWSLPFNTIYSIQISYILLNLKSVSFRESLWFKRRIEKNLGNSITLTIAYTMNLLNRENTSGDGRCLNLTYNSYSNAMNKVLTSFMFDTHWI